MLSSEMTKVQPLKVEQNFDISTITNLASLLWSRAEHSPDNVAYIYIVDGEDDAMTITYSELHHQACQIALAIKDRALGQDKALLLYGPGLDFIAAFFGSIYAGIIAIPTYMPPRQKKIENIKAIMSDAETSIILCSGEIQREIESHIQNNGEAFDAIWINSESTHCYNPDQWLEPLRRSDDIAFFQYTSGSTDNPKAVMVTHANIMANELVIKQAFRHDNETIGLGWLPHYHDMGLIGNILQTIYIGRPCILMSPFHFIQKPLRWLQAISRYRATSSGGPNFAFELCISKIKEQDKHNLDLSCWKLAFTGAEIIRQETLDRFSKAFEACGFDKNAFYPCYGLAESTLFVSGRPLNSNDSSNMIDENCNPVKSSPILNPDDSILEPVSCGNSWDKHCMEIVNPDTMEKCDQGQIGEIWVHGPSVAKGYWRRAEQTEKIFKAKLKYETDKSYLRTGDLGFKRNNNLYITGRLKDLMIIRGQNYHPYDIERTVANSSAALVSNGGAIFAVQIQNEEKVVILQEVERNHLKSINHEHTVSQIRSEVLRHHGLRVFAVALLKPVTIPKTSSGKIMRYKCRQLYIENSLAHIYAWEENRGTEI